jgi:hypothetical protein
MPGTGGETGTEPQPEKLAGFKNVVRLGYVSLFTDLSTEMILGLLPVFIHDQLGAAYAVVGLIERSAEAVNDFFRILTGVITEFSYIALLRLGSASIFVNMHYGIFIPPTQQWGRGFERKIAFHDTSQLDWLFTIIVL